MFLYDCVPNTEYGRLHSACYHMQYCYFSYLQVNIHIMRTIPFDEENFVLGHQVLCLAMLFDFFFSDGNLSSERRHTSVIDVGLCKPVNGELASRSFRGRDRRKMISWKERTCTSGYPY